MSDGKYLDDIFTSNRIEGDGKQQEARVNPPYDLGARGWLTPEWLQDVLQEYAPKQAKELGFQTLKQIAEALVLPELAARQASQPTNICYCGNPKDAHSFSVHRQPTP